MQQVKKVEIQSDHTRDLVRVEANVEELPVFSATKRSRRFDVVEWSREGRDPATGRPIRQKMTLRPAAGLGLPAQRERDIYYLVLAPWIQEHGFGQDGMIGPISYHDACRALGLRRSGKTYSEILDSLKTLATVNIEFEHCILDGNTRKLYGFIERWFGLRYYREEDASDTRYPLRRGEFALLAASWFVASYDANYLKPIDRALYTRLRSPIAKALYGYLDKRAWHSGRNQYRDQVVEDLDVLRERFRLGVRQRKHLLEEFRRAHQDLCKNWPLLRDARMRRVRRGCYEVVYTFSSQTELPLENPENELPLVQELLARGVSGGVAAKLVDAQPAERIRHHLDVFDHVVATAERPKRPGGWLRKRIEEDWAVPEGYQPPEERERIRAQQKHQREAKRAEDEARLREQAEFDAKSPEEKAEIRLNRWLAIQRSLKQPATDDEIAAKRAEYLNQYQDPQQKP